jgi:hypothetical protein
VSFVRIQSKIKVPVYARKAYGEVEVQFHSFFSSALYGVEWFTSCPGSLTFLSE